MSSTSHNISSNHYKGFYNIMHTQILRLSMLWTIYLELITPSKCYRVIIIKENVEL